MLASNLTEAGIQINYRATEAADNTERHLKRKREGQRATAVGRAMPTVLLTSTADSRQLTKILQSKILYILDAYKPCWEILSNSV